MSWLPYDDVERMRQLYGPPRPPDGAPAYIGVDRGSDAGDVTAIARVALDRSGIAHVLAVEYVDELVAEITQRNRARAVRKRKGKR